MEPIGRKTELTWEGKYDANGKCVAPLRVQMPFQTVEMVNESAQERQRALSLFESPGAYLAKEWRNRLIWGDKKYVLPALLPEFSGKVNLIYIDPPFDTGADFSFTASVPDDPEASEDHISGFTKQPSIIEQKAYRDTWGRGLDSYLQWFYEAAVLLHDLLCETGSLYVHLDYHIAHYAKIILDEIFGSTRFLSSIAWKRTSAHSGAGRYGPVHDIIFFYSKSESYTWNDVYQAYDDEYIETFFEQKDPDGRRWKRGDLTGPGVRTGDSGKKWREIDVTSKGRHWQPASYVYEKYRKMTGKDLAVHPLLTRLDELDKIGLIHWPDKRGGMPRYKCYLEDMPGIPLQDVWTDIRPIHNLAEERIGFPTQKPQSLLERIIKASSNEGDLVLDCFVGSGTTAAVAEKSGRRWIGCDLGRFAINTTRKRLLSIAQVRPFVIQNLGKYERQLWSTGEFGNGKQKESKTDAALRQRAYIEFILQLYAGQPIHGYTFLHGLKSGRMVHVGSVDAPISLGDVTQIAAEFKKAIGTGKEAPKTNGVDVLGWDFAFEINETARQQAAAANIQMKFWRIPREVMEKKAVEQGDIKFFELAALSVATKTKDRKATLRLNDFVIPPDDVPEDVRKAVKHWSQWIDYWAVDWDNKGDTFHNEWQTYRTRKDSSLALETTHEYVESGDYRIVVKVIDILGNDTTKTVNLKIAR